MKKKVYLCCVTIIGGVLLAACGAKNSDHSYNMYSEAPAAYAVEEAAYDYDTGDIYMETANEAKAMETGAGDQVAVQSPRKLIRNANMDVETEEFDKLLATIEERVNNLGGYMENYQTSKSSRYYSAYDNRSANMTIRIPATNYDQFVNDVAAVSNVLNRNETIQDVTLQYVDLDSHKKVLLTEQERLLELLEKAETIEDIITIESRLSEVRYQIESMESQLRTYDNQVDYSTIYLYVSEVKQLTPVEELTVGEKIATGFVNSCKTVGNGFVNFFIGLIVSVPFLVVLAIIVVVILLIVKLCIKISNRKKKKNESA